MLTPGRTLQQACAQVGFQPRQTFADGRAREVQAFGCLGQVAAFHHLQKELNAIKTWGRHALNCRS